MNINSKIQILLVDDRTENLLALEAHLEELDLKIKCLLGIKSATDFLYY